jgi:hypothetical protein
MNCLQTSNLLILVRPTEFVKFYDKEIIDLINYQFNDLVSILKQHKINLIVFDSVPNASVSVFPNNWVSSHVNQKTGNKTIVLYPMQNPIRRLERFSPVMNYILHDKSVKKIIDLTHYEAQGRFLESTGAFVLDRVNKTAYCGVAEKADSHLAYEWGRLMGYTIIEFETIDWDRKPVYHTNIVMTIGKQFAIICSEVIRFEEEKQIVLSSLKNSGRQVIIISFVQMHNFCAYCLQVRNQDDQLVLCLSQKAYESFRPQQLALLKAYCDGGLAVVEYSLIEYFGGGSVRCSLLEYGF